MIEVHLYSKELLQTRRLAILTRLKRTRLRNINADFRESLASDA